MTARAVFKGAGGGECDGESGRGKESSPGVKLVQGGRESFESKSASVLLVNRRRYSCPTNNHPRPSLHNTSLDSSVVYFNDCLPTFILSSTHDVRPENASTSPFPVSSFLFLFFYLPDSHGSFIKLIYLLITSWKNYWRRRVTIIYRAQRENTPPIKFFKNVAGVQSGQT